MSSPLQPEVSLKLVIDKKHKKILYGEADKNFIDFLFTILALPVGTVVKLLSAEGMVGALGNLYRSVESLNTNYFNTNQKKDNLLNPKVSVPKSKGQELMQIEYPSAAKNDYYTCSSQPSRNCRNYFTTVFYSTCPACKGLMCEHATYLESADEKKESSSNEVEGYVNGIVTYIVMDDLTVKPMISSMSNFSILRDFEIKDVELIEEKVIKLDTTEGLNLLRALIHSTTVLTDVFLQKIA